jgi:hypothetical protein
LLPSFVAFLPGEALLLAVKHVCLILRLRLFRGGHSKLDFLSIRKLVADRHSIAHTNTACARVAAAECVCDGAVSPLQRDADATPP